MALESPIAITGRRLPSTLITARSLGGSEPISFASSTRRSDSSTLIFDAESIT
jgi:hypothetical protein